MIQRYRIANSEMAVLEPNSDGIVVLYDDHEKAYQREILERLDKIIALLEGKNAKNTNNTKNKR